METADRNDLDRNIAQTRVMLSLLALVSWYVDPAGGGWFFIDQTSLIVLISYFAYSLATFVLIERGVAASLLPRISTVLDLAFAAVTTVITEGPTSPSWLFFVFAIIAVDCRTGFRAAIYVTSCSALVYFLLLAAFVPGLRHEYVMRAAYLAIIGYLVGLMGAQRARFEARVRELERVVERHSIARALHDGYVQALAGVNLRLEACRALMQTERGGEALAQITDLQKRVAREYDTVRAYIHSLADVAEIAEAEDLPFAVETLFEVAANFEARAPIVEQVLQIVLEGARNTWQHGMARCAAIKISGTDHLIRIAIDDDGIGFRNSGHQPWSIAARVAEYGGRLRIGDAEPGGAHIEIEIPTA